MAQIAFFFYKKFANLLFASFENEQSFNQICIAFAQ